MSHRFRGNLLVYPLTGSYTLSPRAIDLNVLGPGDLHSFVGKRASREACGSRLVEGRPEGLRLQRKNRETRVRLPSASHSSPARLVGSTGTRPQRTQSKPEWAWALAGL